MYTAKSILKVAPVFLEKPRRIEAMLFLYFVALMIVGLPVFDSGRYTECEDTCH